MSSIGEPIEIFLTHEERDTVVGALRLWQAVAQGDRHAFDKLLDIPSLRPPVGSDVGAWGGLTSNQINNLCNRMGKI